MQALRPLFFTASFYYTPHFPYTLLSSYTHIFLTHFICTVFFPTPVLHAAAAAVTLGCLRVDLKKAYAQLQQSYTKQYEWFGRMVGRVYSSSLLQQLALLYTAGKTVKEICNKTGDLPALHNIQEIITETA